MTPTERHLLERLQIMNSVPSLRRIGNPGNRARFISELEAKAASGHLSEPERIAEAEQRHAAARQEARDQLLGRSPSPHPVPSTVFAMTASAGEQARNAARVAAERRAWLDSAAARERRREQLAAGSPEIEAIRRYNSLRRRAPGEAAGRRDTALISLACGGPVRRWGAPWRWAGPPSQATTKDDKVEETS